MLFLNYYVELVWRTNYSSTAANLYYYIIQVNTIKVYIFLDTLIIFYIFYFDLHNECNKIHSNILQLNKANISDEFAIFFWGGDIFLCILNNSINIDLYSKVNSFILYIYLVILQDIYLIGSHIYIFSP